MTRRDICMAFGIAITTVVLLTIAVGTMVMLSAHAVDRFNGGAREARAAVETGTPATADRVPVLCYHYVRGLGGPLHVARVFGYVVLSLPVLDDSELWKVSRRGFERQMAYLVSRGYHTVSLDELRSTASRQPSLS